MRQTKRFAVVGSDARQAAAGRALARAGYTVGGVQQLPQADCILLPLPLEQSGLPLAQLLGMAKPGALALAGKVTDSARTIARAAGVELVDYFARPELTVYNAMGGRAAEQLVLGDISTGASNDISRATQLARKMVGTYGMSEEHVCVPLYAAALPRCRSGRHPRLPQQRVPVCGRDRRLRPLLGKRL